MSKAKLPNTTGRRLSPCVVCRLSSSDTAFFFVAKCCQCLSSLPVSVVLASIAVAVAGVVADVVPFFCGRRPIVRWPRTAHIRSADVMSSSFSPVVMHTSLFQVRVSQSSSGAAFLFFAHLPCDSLSGPHAQLVSPTSRLADFTSRRTNGYVPNHGSVNFRPPAAHECVLLQVTQASALAVVIVGIGNLKLEPQWQRISIR